VRQECFGQFRHGAGEQGIFTRQVFNPQGRDGRKGIRAVGRALGFHEAGGFFHHFGAGLGIGGGLHGVHAGLFRLFAGFAQLGVGQQHHGGTVLVVKEPVLDGLFKYGFASLNACLEGVERSLPGQRGQRVAIIQPCGQRLHHGRKPTGEAPGIVFTVGEFHAVDGGFHCRAGDAFFRQLGQGVKNEQFGLLHIARGHALETGRVVHLAQVSLQPAAGGVFTKAGGDERLAQGGAGQAFKDMLEHFHQQCLMHVPTLAQEPVDREQRALFALGGGIGYFDLPWGFQTRLQRHVGIDRSGSVALKRCCRQAQALVFRVVAPEEKAGVAGVVVAAVKIVKGLVGEVGDVFRIAAGIKAVERIGEERLLALLRKDGIGRGVNPLHLVVDHALV